MKRKVQKKIWIKFPNGVAQAGSNDGLENMLSRFPYTSPLVSEQSTITGLNDYPRVNSYKHLDHKMKNGVLWLLVEMVTTNRTDSRTTNRVTTAAAPQVTGPTPLNSY